MPIPSNYLINFTDPINPAIQVLGGDKNGPGFVVQRTSIVLLGQYAPLYGEDINENFLHLLENFSNKTPPNAPIQGQLWYSNDYTYDNRSLSAANFQYQGDFYFRVRTKNALGSSFWALPRTVLVDDNIGNLTSYTPLPGDLWIDTAPNSTDGARVGVSWIGSPERTWAYPELKIFDADANKFVSIGRNYLKLNDNGSQTITSNISLVGTLDVSGATTLHSSLVVIDATTLHSSLTVTTTLSVGTNVTVGGALTVNENISTNSNLQVTGTSSLLNNVTIYNNASLTSNGDCTFIDGTLTSLIVSGSTKSNTLQVNSSASIAAGLTLGTNVALTNLGVTGSVDVLGDLTLRGAGYGNLDVSSKITANELAITSTATINSTLSVSGMLTANNTIDMVNTRIINLSAPNDPLDAVNRQYIDTNCVRLNDDLGIGNNTMSAVLVLDNFAQNDSDNNAATVKFVKDQDLLRVSKTGDSIDHLYITAPMPAFSLTNTGNTSLSGHVHHNTTSYFKGIATFDEHVHHNLTLTVEGKSWLVGNVHHEGTAYFKGYSTFQDTIEPRGDILFGTQGRRVGLWNGYIDDMVMKPTPADNDATNVRYVSDNFAKVDPPLPKNCDVRVFNGTAQMFVNGNWTILQTSTYQVPIGTIQLYAGYTPPTGWVECDGAVYPVSGNEELAGVLLDLYGGVLGVWFRLPDLRGQFVRGWSNTHSVDAGRVLGSSQSDTIGSHSHEFLARGMTGYAGDSGAGGGMTTKDTLNITLATQFAGDVETRPKNIAIMYIIKI